jgi:glutamyl-Q tRNA(Asp) synthetase
VIRGADLASSTDRQIELATRLGRPMPPAFVHHPLVLRPDGQKLSKSSGDAGVRELRAAGVTSPEVIGRAAAAVGLTEHVRSIAPSDVADLFRSPA